MNEFSHTPHKTFWTVKETSEQFSVSPNHVYRMVQKGKIEKIKSKLIGKRILIPKKQFIKKFNL
tara:strand:+ start:1518 stop:1709 length:192 start_codon:yes stop_codon:yes gene_type:complete